MIIRRLAEGIRNQDWFVVLVEILIVVVGIFVGLQVDDWNQTRKERIEERQLIEAISEEATATIELVSGRIVQLETIHRNLLQGILVVQNSQVPSLEGDQCGAIWGSHILSPLFPVQMSSIQDIVASTKVFIVQDPTLQSSILDFHREYLKYDQFLILMQDDIANLVDFHADAFPRALDDDGQNVVSCEVGIIRNNQTVLNKIISNYNRRGAALTYMRNYLSMLKSVDKLLKKSLAT